jgi:hypothetical protein
MDPQAHEKTRVTGAARVSNSFQHLTRTTTGKSSSEPPAVRLTVAERIDRAVQSAGLRLTPPVE